MKNKLTKQKTSTTEKKPVTEMPIPFDNDDGNKPAVVKGKNLKRKPPMAAGAAKEADKNVKADRGPVDDLFDSWEQQEPAAEGPQESVAVDSFEADIGYSSLFRQMNHAFVRRVAFYRSTAGGTLSVEDARREAFHGALDEAEAKKLLERIMRWPVESLSFIDLLELQQIAPRVAEGLWEMTKDEGRKEFESGHLSANITFPVGYMKEVWNIARYLGVRESFMEEWKPKGGIEISLIDMLAQSYFQWQYWLEQTVKRSQTREREMHPDYAEWMSHREEMYRINGWIDGYWFRPFVSEQQALDSAVQMADRWNRIFMRTLRQLRDLRRYSLVTINNPNQVNIAAEGGKQVNMT